MTRNTISGSHWSQVDIPVVRIIKNVTPQGVVQLKADNRLRPTTILAPDGILTFVWSNDASHIDLTVQVSGETKTYPINIDLSDPALLAVARGEKPPHPASSLMAGKVLFAKHWVQDVQSDVDNYMKNLLMASTHAHNLVWNFRRQHPGSDPVTLITLQVLRNNRDIIWEYYKDQRSNCQYLCTNLCYIPCLSLGGRGACFRNWPNPPCDELMASECPSGWVFIPDLTCPGACYITILGFTECAWSAEWLCLLAPSKSVGLTTRWCPGSCEAPRCSDGP